MTKVFKSDGCSGYMSKIYQWVTGKKLSFRNCCVEHDLDYYEGGTRLQRLNSDRKLMACVVSHGYPDLAYTMFRIIRFWNHPLMPTKKRWGNKYDNICSYDTQAKLKEKEV